MIAVIGHFRFPAETLEQAREPMKAVIAASRAEPGCHAYSYAEDVAEPGLFRVTEMWDSREALSAHFQTEHMREWQARRAALGFFGRELTLFDIAASDVEL